MSWQSEPLSALTLKIGSGSTPRGGDSVYISEGTSLIRSQNVYNNEFSTDGLVYIDEKTAEKMKGVSVEKEDVLINITGDSVARCCLVNDEVLPARVNQHVAILRTNPKKLLPHFLAFYMVSPFMQAKLLSWAGTGGTRKALTKGMLEGFEIPVPPIDDQKKIVEKIKTYNDLIENNRRRIQLLEESARLLYQEWFVHLRFPGHEQVRITDGVPEGWSIKRVDSLLGKVAKKKKIKKEEYLEDGVVPCVDQSQEFIGGYIDDEEAAITENLPVVVFGDHTRIVKFIDFSFAPGADGTQLLVPNDEEIPRDFFYFMISSINVANAFYARHFKFLKAKDVLVPEKKLMHEFSLVVKDNMLQIKLLRNQNRSLAKARDLLLPKLMSGELTV